MSTLLTRDDAATLERVQWQALAVGVIALVACVIGAFFSPTQFFRAYLASYTFWLGIPLGSMVILMIYFLTGGAWGFTIRRALEAGMQTLPVMAVLFTPIAVGVGYLYAWAQAAHQNDPDIRNKAVYLNAPFWWGRVALYFILFGGLVLALTYLSRRQDEGDPHARRRLGWVAGPGLLIYGIFITFASVDWVMSLQPAFRSTIFGPVFASSEILTAHAFVTLVMLWLIRRPPLDALVSVEVLSDLGNLMLAFLVIWSYVFFFQFMLIWIANLPYDSIWYIDRGSGGWVGVDWALFLVGFAGPFLCLLVRKVKRTPPLLAAVAGTLFFMQLVFDYWQVDPAFQNTSLAEHWMDFLTPLAIGGLWLASFLWVLRRTPALPEHDPNKERATHFRHLDEEMAAREEAIVHG
jgi:hypothetical protein